jgi:hypothetical protein
MPKRLPKLQIVRRRDPQTQAVNEKIARLVAVKPWGDIYAAFSLAAHLATEAIEAATELQQMPGVASRRSSPRSSTGTASAIATTPPLYPLPAETKP